MKKRLIAAGALSLLLATISAPMASAEEVIIGDEAKARFTLDAAAPERIALTGPYDPSLSVFPTPGPIVLKQKLSIMAGDSGEDLTGKSQGTGTWKIYAMPKLAPVDPTGDNVMGGNVIPEDAVLLDTGSVEMVTGEFTITSTKIPTIDPAEVEAGANIKIWNYTSPTWDPLVKNYYLTLSYPGNDRVEPMTSPSYIALSSLYLEGRSGSGVDAGANCLPVGQKPHPRLEGQPINWCPTAPVPTDKPTPIETPTPELGPDPIIKVTPKPVVPEVPVVEVTPEPTKKAQPLIETGLTQNDGNQPSALFLGLGILGITGAVLSVASLKRSRKKRH